MRKTPEWFSVITLLAGLALVSTAEAADLKLAGPFSENMVLQRGRPIPVWGTAVDGTRISVQLNGKSAVTQAVKGRWEVRLPAMKQGGPYVLTVSSQKEHVVLNNVLVGEVWIASGQSNMEFGLPGAANGSEEVAAALYPNIRFFTVPKATSARPLDTMQGSWVTCTPENALSFSAVAYFFARKLAKEDGLNVGIINSSWGGTPAESWADEAALRSDPEFAELLPPLDSLKQGPNPARLLIEKQMAEWEKFWDQVYEKNRELGDGWAAPDANLTAWTETDVPKAASILAKIDGVVWYRKEVEIPETWKGKDLVLSLGPVDDFDMTYFNGKEIGRTTKSTPNWYLVARNYTIPGALVRAGKNTIAVRIVDSWLGGGFGGDAASMKIRLKEAPQEAAISLAGAWRTRTAFQFDANRDPVRPEQGDESQVATALYNAMIAPLVPFGIRGVIWYQGESNASRYQQYGKLFPALITSWRKAWGQGDFPFYFVQLPNFMPRVEIPSESEWAGLREAQSMTLRLNNTGMAVAIDVGDPGNIHPTNKQDIGKRLALWAQAKLYGRKNIEFAGPLYRSMTIKGNKVEIAFDHAKGGLLTKGGGKVEGFAIAGADGKFVWAEAKIVGEKVIVSHPQIAEPKAVRYGWADNPAVNLVNRAGLPASPFRTDRN